MKNKKKKVFWLSIGGITLIGAGIGGYYYFSNNHKNSKSDIRPLPRPEISVHEQDVHSIFNSIDIFPKISNFEIYSEVRIENGKGIITDDLIAFLINKVIKGAKVTDGKINFNYEIAPDKQSARVTFNWEKDKDHVFWKTYKLTLSV